MKHNINNLIYSLLITAIGFVFWGCEPVEGPIGPEGPIGAQGPVGPQGPQGQQGTPGTANVMYSNWISFNSTNWTQVVEFGRISQLYEIQESHITDDIINTGVILVYVKFGGATSTRLLPYTGYITSSTKEQYLWFRLVTGKIVIVFNNLNETTNPGTFGTGNQFRYIVIPGGTLIRNNKGDIDFTKLTFEEVLNLL